MENNSRSGADEGLSSGPVVLDEIIASAKGIFDEGCETTNVGFLTIEHSVLIALGALSDMRPSVLRRVVVSQTRLSPQSREEIWRIAPRKPGPKRDCFLVAQIVNMQLEAMYPEVVGEEEERNFEIFKRVNHVREDQSKKDFWMAPDDRFALLERINRDRILMGLEPVDEL